MKTPDEIRAGLGCCYVLHSCKGCPYDDDGCIPALWEDSVSYIGQLEAGQHRPLQQPMTPEELHALIDAGDEAVIFCETKQDKETTYGTILYHGRIYDRYGEAPGPSISDMKHMARTGAPGSIGRPTKSALLLHGRADHVSD